jgi:hypothetical protein
MANHITPIKYEALTPDSFLLLFRTTDQHGSNHYFVSLETDFQNGLEGARCTIEDWHQGKVIDFWPTKSKRGHGPSEDVKTYQAATSGPYLAMLAEVNRPTHKGYWAESIDIMPGDKIGDKIKNYPQKVQTSVRDALAKVLQHASNPSDSFVDSLKARKQGITKDDINQTNMAVSLYVQPDGRVDCFYSYVHQTGRQ